MLKTCYIPGIVQGAGSVGVSNIDMVSIHTELEQMLTVGLHHKHLYLSYLIFNFFYKGLFEPN